uniref:Uncharacterized protein n=1 Tax=Oryza punctata TaxID=4537 RepID=A0A0E0LKH9_ORYPU
MEGEGREQEDAPLSPAPHRRPPVPVLLSPTPARTSSSVGCSRCSSAHVAPPAVTPLRPRRPSACATPLPGRHPTGGNASPPGRLRRPSACTTPPAGHSSAPSPPCRSATPPPDRRLAGRPLLRPIAALPVGMSSLLP